MRSEPPSAEARRLHPLTVVFAAGTTARNLVLPALVGGVSVGQGEIDRIIPVILIVLAVPALVAAAAKYAIFRYTLTPDELVIRSGVLSRTHRVIPLARVQNVDVRQGVAQRLLRVAELRVETAGAGQEAEAVLEVLGEAEAQAVRADLLARRRAARAEAAGAVAPADEVEAGAAVESAPPVPAGEDAVLLKRLSFSEVMLAGATANEAGVIAAAAVGALQFLDDLPLPGIDRVFGPAEAWIRDALGTGGAALAMGALALVVVIVMLGWAISVVGAVVRYHGFTLSRAGGELRKRYGLLTVHHASVPLERVQAVRVEEPVLRRALGLVSLMIETAGAAPGGGGEGREERGAEAFVPLARRSEVVGLVREIFGDFAADAERLRPVHPRARRRALRRWAILLWVPALVLAATAWFAGAAGWMPALLPVLPLPWVLARREYAIRGWKVEGGYVLARTGMLGRVTWIVPEHKLQTLHLRESPMQRRHGLASLVVDTAAGGRQAAIDDLAEADARALLEALAAGVRAAARNRRGRRRRRAASSTSTVSVLEEQAET